MNERENKVKQWQNERMKEKGGDNVTENEEWKSYTTEWKTTIENRENYE